MEEINDIHFSVLMSLYSKERPEYLEQCINSLLRQTVKPSEIVIVLDGPITLALNMVLEKYISLCPQLFRIVPLPVNKGLGLALAEGLPACNYELIARMDTDDIAKKDRFEKQLKVFANNPNLDICGSYIIEFSGTPKNILAARKVPLTHEEISKYQKQRSAFNHMTVMFKKSAVLRAGNYQNAPLMEDDYLWIHMLQTGSKCMNLDEYLVYARTGYAMIARRGGWAYFKKYRAGRRKILETGYISYWDYLKTIIVQFVVALLPKKIRMFVFTRLLRR